MPRVIRIRSENDQFQYIETLRRNREKRHKSREFFVEGVRPINQALAYGWDVAAFAYADDARLSDWAAGILAASHAARHYAMPYALLRKLSGKTDTSELIALVTMPEDDLSRIPAREDARIVVFDRPSSPGNLGTLIRSCDALGVDGLVISGHAVDLYDPETISATTGSFFAVPAVRVAGPNDLRPWLDGLRRALGSIQVVGSSAKATLDLADHDFGGPTVLVIGNETWGMSAAYRELCDVVVTIPIHGSASSLNVSCAASIMLYEVDRQRRGQAQQSGQTPARVSATDTTERM